MCTSYLYMKWTVEVIKNQRLPQRLMAERVDRWLDRELVLLFLSKQLAEIASHLYYAPTHSEGGTHPRTLCFDFCTRR